MRSPTFLATIACLSLLALVPAHASETDGTPGDDELSVDLLPSPDSYISAVDPIFSVEPALAIPAAPTYVARFFAVPPPATPEPASLMLLGAGIAGLGLARRRNRT